VDEQSRYRATGSLFLLAVAIICLPMLLDGEGSRKLQIAPLSVPEPLPDVQSLSQVAPADELPARVGELRAQVDENGFYTESSSRVGEPVLSIPDDETRIWAVQVASLKDHGRAIELRDELRELGYEAFLSTLKLNGEVLNRVAVGPLLNETDAVTLQQTLSLEVEQPATLMAFSN